MLGQNGPNNIQQVGRRTTASDDKIDEIISIQLVKLVNTIVENSELIELLSKKHGGSRIGHSPNVHRDHIVGHE